MQNMQLIRDGLDSEQDLMKLREGVLNTAGEEIENTANVAFKKAYGTCMESRIMKVNVNTTRKEILLI